MGRVRLQVTDLARSVGFYTRVLGFRVLRRTDAAAELGAMEGAEVLLELRERPGARPVPPHGRLGLYHFAILLPDRSALGRLIAHLARTGVRAGGGDHLVSEAVYLSDPDGLGIEVYADRPRESWRTHETARGSELTMDTSGLDAAGLVRAAGGAEWNGLPAGTRIGHVHLHVGDLAAAEAFYHTGLGLDEVVWSYPGALFFSAGGYHHHVGVNVWAAGAPPAGEDEARLIDWELVLPERGDVAAVARNLEEAGHPVERTEEGVVARDPSRTAVRITAAR